MINSKKKGFTIVELVIVVAVVAILAAVLIPTFSSLVRKAQESADQQLAKNLNTALTIAEAEGKEIDDFSDVLQILQDEGYVISNLNPTAEDNWYAWDSKTNQILYLNSDFSIIFKVKESSEQSNWIIGVGTSEDKATVENANITAFYTPNNTEDLYTQLEQVLASNNPETIIFGGDVDFNESNSIEISNANDLTFNLAGSTFGGAVQMDKAPVLIEKGTFTIKNGTMSAAGWFESEGTNLAKISSALQIGAKGGTNSANIANISVENMLFKTNGTAIRFYAGTGTVANTNIIATNGQSVYSQDANVTLNNVNGTSYNYENIFSTTNSIVTIENGTYNIIGTSKFGDPTVTPYNLNVYNHGSIVIKDGEFGAYADVNTYSNNLFKIHLGTITISGGTFNGNKFSDYNTNTAESIAFWKSLCSENGNGYNVVISNGVVTISK